MGVLESKALALGSVSGWTLISVHPETPIKIPKLKLWTPNNGHLGIQSFSFGRVSGWALIRYDEEK